MEVFLKTENLQLSNITLSTVTVSWVVPYTPTSQQYSIMYGVQANALDQSWGLLNSLSDITETNQEYTMTVEGLTHGTVYFIRVSSTFGHNRIYSEQISFLTLDPRMYTMLKFNIGITVLIIQPNSSYRPTTQLYY